MSDINKLIFGKSDKQRIVSLEVSDGSVELFIQQEDGSIVSEFATNKYWLLSHSNLGQGFVRLKGNLHFKYGKQFSTRDEFYKAKNQYKNNDIYTIADAKENSMVNKGLTYYRGLKPSDVSILSFDIETTGLNGETDKLLLISNTFRNHKGEIERKLFAYDDYENEGDMLYAWTLWVNLVNPSIICGHNIYGFDLPFMQARAELFGVSLELGRNGSAIQFNSYDSKFRKDGSQSYSYRKVKCYGRELVDTMFLAIKYDVGRKYESYGLKKIIEQEGLRKEGRVMYDASQIRYKYQDKAEWKKIKEYCVHDSDEALALYDLMIGPTFYLTQSIPKSFQLMIESATGSQINSMMVRSYLQDAHSVPKATDAEEFSGAISFGNPGIFSNVFKVDVASLYPSIMLQYEVFSPDKDPNGHFLTILQTFTEERLKNKKLAKTDKYYDDLQNAQKIFINSCYGFLGATGLNFNAPDLAAFITKTGTEILTAAIEWAEDKGYRVINGDTDSISYTKADQSPFTEQDRLDDLKSLNSLYPERIHFEDDGLYQKVIILKAKNYILYDGKKIKIKGSSLKSSKLEAALKGLQNEFIEALVFDRNNFVEIYNKYVKQATDITSIRSWSSKKTITAKTESSERKNETKLMDAIAGADYKEGDKAYVFFMPDGSLCLADNFTGVYDKLKMCERVFKSIQVFENVLDITPFLNYKLKKNQKALDELIKM